MLSVLIAFIFISSIASIIVSYVSTNSIQIQHQEVIMQSRLLSTSGIEIATDALLREQPGTPPKKLIDSFGDVLYEPGGTIVKRPQGRNVYLYEPKALVHTIDVNEMNGKILIKIYKDTSNKYVIVESLGIVEISSKIQATTKAKLQIDVDNHSKSSIKITYGN